MPFSTVPIAPQQQSTTLHHNDKSRNEEYPSSYQNNEEMHVGKTTASSSLNTKSTILHDEKGNLRYVNFVVRHPIFVFLLVLFICVLMTISLVNSISSSDNDGGSKSPFTPDEHIYDLHDIRSIAYDSLRLAYMDVFEHRIEILQEKNPVKDQRLDHEINNSEIEVQKKLGDVIYWIYESKTDKGVFTKDVLPIMKSAETMFTKDKSYTDYCWLNYKYDFTKSISNDNLGQNDSLSSDLIGNDNNDITTKTYTTECIRELSIVNIFYASQWNSTLAKSIINDLSSYQNVQKYNMLAPCIEYNMFCQHLMSLVSTSISMSDYIWAKSMDENIRSMMMYWDGEGVLNDDTHEVSLLLAHVNQLITKSPYINFFFDSNFTIINPISMYTRSIVYFGSPLSGADEKNVTSGIILKRYILDNFLSTLKNISQTDHNQYVNTYYFMGALIFDIIIDILLSDALKAILSFTLVFLYLRLMVGSWFLSIVGMIEIILSLPIAWFFYSNVLGIKYFSTLNVLCLFIVAAIGADDIFVFMDAYKQSANKGKDVLESLETRMSWVYRRSGHAMAITSSTTCLAFLCTMISPIAGTRSFGMFAALVIFFDYILVMTLFCTAVVIYHDRFEEEECCCSCFCNVNEPTPTEKAMSQITSEVGPKESRISFFFRNKVANFILRPINRRLLAVPISVWIIIMVYYTTKIEPTQTTEQALRSDHPLQKGANILSNKFPKVQQDTGTRLYFIWGLKEVERVGVNQLLNPDYIGSASYDTTFDFSSQCQANILNICDSLKTDMKYEEHIKRKGDGLRFVECFVEELGAYNYLGDNWDCNYVKSGLWKNETWEVTPEDINQTISSFMDYDSCFWDGKVSSTYKESVGWDGEKLRYIGISIESSILDPYSTLPEDKVRDYYDQIMDITDDFQAITQDTCKGNIIMTDLDQKFIFMNNQKIYRTSAISGSILGVGIAFVVLLISTRKVYVSIFASITILSVLVSVIGSVTTMGWTLGTNEAILISILAGFSVDYVVHLAHAYVHSDGDSDNRLRETFGEMGISVFSGMATSVVASIPLFLCTLTFFAKFGTFLCLTIAFSWAFANFGFMSLIASFVPNNTQPSTVKVESRSL